MLRGRRSQAEEGRVQVEGGDQCQQTRVGDHTEARQRLDLLPSVEFLPQGCSHLGQGLPEGGGADMEARGSLVLVKQCDSQLLIQFSTILWLESIHTSS